MESRSMTALEYLKECRHKGTWTVRDEKICRFLIQGGWASTSQVAWLFWLNQKSAWVASRRRLEHLKKLGIVVEGPSLIWQAGPPEKVWCCQPQIAQALGGSSEVITDISIEDWMAREWQVFMARITLDEGIRYEEVDAGNTFADVHGVLEDRRIYHGHTHFVLYWGTQRSSMARALHWWRHEFPVQCSRPGLCTVDRNIVIPAVSWPLRPEDDAVARVAQRVVNHTVLGEEEGRAPLQLLYLHHLGDLLRES